MTALAKTTDNIAFSDYNTKEFVTVHIADQTFGVEVKEIQDVFTLTHLTPVPGAKKEIAGVLNLRGRIVTAIDARIRLGLPKREGTYTGMMAVGIEHEGEAFGILVDKVGEVLRLHDNDFEKNPINMDATWRSISKGIYRLDGKLLMAMDIKQIIGITKA